MREIFISYRSEDAPIARLLSDRLRSRFGENSIFRDCEGIRPGQHFPKVLEAALQSCRVVLAIISPNWNRKDDSGRPEIMNQKDFIRFELMIAFRERKPIIPVLVQSASMPIAKELPRGLKKFTNLHAIELSDSRWEYDVKRLTEAIHTEAGLEIRPPLKLPLSQPQPSSTGISTYPFTGTTFRSPLLDPKLIETQRQERAKRLQEENERKKKARENNPPFYQRYSWWISLALNIIICIGLAFAIVPLVEWLLAGVLGWFSLSPSAALIDKPIFAVAMSGFSWGAVYSGVSAIYYADDPDQGMSVFFLHGLIWGWVLWYDDDFEPGPGLAGSFPLNVFAAWTLARSASLAGSYFLEVNPDIIAYTVLGISTALCAAWYLIDSLDSVA